MDQFHLLTCVSLFVYLISKFGLTTSVGPGIEDTVHPVSNENTVSPASNENEEKPSQKIGDTRKHFSFNLAHVLTKVNGISLKIDGLIDLGPKWNFEYTFVPYDTNKNVGREGPEIEVVNENDAATTTPAKIMDTERAITKKKSRHKSTTRKVAEYSETPNVKHSEKSNKPEHPETPHVKHSEKSNKPENSETPHVKHSEKRDKPHKKSKRNKTPKMPEDSPWKTEKTEQEEEYPNKSEYLTGKLNKHSHTGKSNKHHKPKSTPVKVKLSKGNINTTTTTIKTTPKFNGTTPDFIYKDADNKSLILRSPHKVQEDTRLRDFTVHVYKQALRIFEDLKKKVNDTESTKQIDKLLRDYREKFAEFVNETQYVTVKTRLGTQKVILNTMESSNMILKKLIDHLMADSAQKTVLRNEVKGVAGLLQAKLEKEMEIEYKHVCSKFGICRSQYVFSNFLADVIGEIIKVNDKKMQIASDSLTEVIKEQHLKNHLQAKVEKRFRQDIEYFEQMNPDQIRAVLQIFRGILVNKYKPLPIMGSLEPKLMNRSLVVLDLIDLFDEKIQPNEENKLAWTDITASYRDWADGNRDDVSEIMDAFVRHVMKSGLKKFDAKTTKLLNDKLKIYYDIKR